MGKTSAKLKIEIFDLRFFSSTKPKKSSESDRNISKLDFEQSTFTALTQAHVHKSLNIIFEQFENFWTFLIYQIKNPVECFTTKRCELLPRPWKTFSIFCPSSSVGKVISWYDISQAENMLHFDSSHVVTKILTLTNLKYFCITYQWYHLRKYQN